MASLESTAYARQWNDQLTAELNEHREKLGNLETYEEDANSSRLNLLVRLEYRPCFVIYREELDPTTGDVSTRPIKNTTSLLLGPDHYLTTDLSTHIIGQMDINFCSLLSWKSCLTPCCMLASVSSAENKQAMLESMQQLLGEVRNSEAAKKETATRLAAEIKAASARIAAGPGWTPEQEVSR